MSLKHGRISLVLILAGTLWSAPGWTQNEEPIQLESDRASLDNATGKSTYTGNVVLTRGKLRITGDVMHVYTGEGRNLDRVVVEGSPATYHDLPQGETEPVEAEAPRMEYYAEGPERIRLLGGAVLQQGPNRFQGETVVYDVAEDRVLAEGREGAQDRIQVTIFPDRTDGGGTADEPQ